jgi:hypothetical protein
VLYSVAADGSGVQAILSWWPGISRFPASGPPEGQLIMTMTSTDEMAPDSIALLTPGDPMAVLRLVAGSARMPALSPMGAGWPTSLVRRDGKRSTYEGSRARPDSGPFPRTGVASRAGDQTTTNSFIGQAGKYAACPFVRWEGRVLGPPTILFEVPYVTMAGSRMWDVAPNGQWFVMVEGHEVFDEFIMVLDWFQRGREAGGTGEQMTNYSVRPPGARGQAVPPLLLARRLSYQRRVA